MKKTTLLLALMLMGSLRAEQTLEQRLLFVANDTKSSLLLDFKRGAQCDPPVCVGVLLGSAGQGASKQTSVHTAETAVPPFFCAAKSNFKEIMV